jgi:WXG100 family type VII secretion target
MAQGVSIKIDPQKMREAMSVIQTELASIDNNFKNIASEAKSLEPYWQGKSAEAYQTLMTKLSDVSPEIVRILHEYVNDLGQIAGEFETTENRNLASDEALPGDIF